MTEPLTGSSDLAEGGRFVVVVLGVVMGALLVVLGVMALSSELVNPLKPRPTADSMARWGLLLWGIICWYAAYAVGARRRAGAWVALGAGLATLPLASEIPPLAALGLPMAAIVLLCWRAWRRGATTWF